MQERKQIRNGAAASEILGALNIVRLRHSLLAV